MNRKDKIIIAALELLASGGINKMTTKQLAEVQGISQPALYNQYKSKNDIILSVIDEYASYDDRIMDTIVKENMDGETAIDYYITRFSELYQSYFELVTINLSLDLYFYEDDAREKMRKITQKKYDFLEEYLTKNPIKNQTFNAKFISKLINDLLQSEVKRWKHSGQSYDLVEAVKVYINKLLTCNIDL